MTLDRTQPNMKSKNYGSLGKSTEYKDKYNPQLLFAIPRTEARAQLGLSSELPFIGNDRWNCYEISWLDNMGKPRVALGVLDFQATSPHIVESKSVKLYLNSLNMCRFESVQAVETTIAEDLTTAVGQAVKVQLITDLSSGHFQLPPGICIDDRPTRITNYSPQPGYLFTTDQIASEKLYSNLLKTNCPVTGQPDWATIVIFYSGQKIDRDGLLRYLISFREESGFHENCVERIFTDISRRCEPDRLSVYGGFTRRGGIDINPFRSSTEQASPDSRFLRQ